MSTAKIKEFNKMIEVCANSIKVDSANSNERAHYKNTKAYQKDLADSVKGFKLTDEQKGAIEVIVYNSKNSDGLGSASIVFHYREKQPALLGIGGGFNDIERQFRNLAGKHVIMLDLNYSRPEEYQAIAEQCASLIIIDDHSPVGYQSPTYFTSNDAHATVASTWAIFYPGQPPPPLVQVIDTSDSKKYIAGLTHTNFIALAVGFRTTNNPYIPRTPAGQIRRVEEMWELIEGGKPQLLMLVGRYMDEAMENIKEQIAINAVVRTFQGHRVGVLNFGDPVLTARVGRQIVSNLNRHEHKIDFAVLWVYEYNKNMFRVKLIDDHQQTKVHLGDLARDLGKKGGSGKGGGGHQHVGNFFWPGAKAKEFMSLFK